MSRLQEQGPQQHMDRSLAVAVAVCALLWLGLLLGVAFLATPVKFLAPSLTLPVALDVGRQTFAVFNALELGLGVLLWVLTLTHGWVAACGWACRLLGGLLLLLVLSQSLWLLPLLDARVEVILQGGQPQPSSLHKGYIAVDLVKLALLAALSWMSLAYLLVRPGSEGR